MNDKLSPQAQRVHKIASETMQDLIDKYEATPDMIDALLEAYTRGAKDACGELEQAMTESMEQQAAELARVADIAMRDSYLKGMLAGRESTNNVNRSTAV